MIKSIDDFTPLEIAKIKKKIKNYKIQDLKIISRNQVLYDDFKEREHLKFIECIDIIIKQGFLGCYLCNQEVFIIRESKEPMKKYYRDFKQFTLDRINNRDTHHKDNVKVCCLSCNILKGNIYTEYEFSKFF